MSSIIERLSEIETTAEAIVEHAQKQKEEIEQELQEERNQFDLELEEKTQGRLAKIREEGDRRVEAIMAKQKEKNQVTIHNLEKEFDENHTAYAEEILKHIIEV